MFLMYTIFILTVTCKLAFEYFISFASYLLNISVIIFNILSFSPF
jgi:hypothetical protein